jgi:DNA-binding response OmpR family regulator
VIHLLLTDVVMPRLSGREFIDKVIGSRPNVKVLFMSGYTNDEFIKHSVEDSNMSLIHKPFSPDELLKRVRQILDSK